MTCTHTLSLELAWFPGTPFPIRLLCLLYPLPLRPIDLPPSQHNPLPLLSSALLL